MMLVALFLHQQSERQIYHPDNSSGEESRSLMSVDTIGASVPSTTPLMETENGQLAVKVQAPTVFR